MYQNFLEYQTYKGTMPKRKTGVMISHGAGDAVAYALYNLQARGEIFIKPGDKMYEGMIIGVNNKGVDLVVNALRGKKLTNMRASGSDDAISLIPPRQMTIEFALEFIADDELVEITSKNIRLRKIHLVEGTRRRIERGGKER
jgi:GTP-binding protein